MVHVIKLFFSSILIPGSELVLTKSLLASLTASMVAHRVAYNKIFSLNLITNIRLGLKHLTGLALYLIF